MPAVAQVNKANTDYINELIGQVTALPALALRKYAAEAYKYALDLTHQDSGNAAYNWLLRVDTPPTQSWLQHYGKPPVGPRGSKRGRGDATVIEPRVKEGAAALNSVTGQSTVYIQNNIDSLSYTENAGLTFGGAEVIVTLVEDKVTRQLSSQQDAFQVLSVGAQSNTQRLLNDLKKMLDDFFNE